MTKIQRLALAQFASGLMFITAISALIAITAGAWLTAAILPFLNPISELLK